MAEIKPGVVRPVTLNASKAGMTRLRTKGGASPETLFELTNGYVNASRCPQQRPGTTWKFNFADTGHTGNAGLTKGLVAFQGVLYTFSARALSSGSTSFVIQRLMHPTNGTADLKAVHFSKPYMGYLYVVGEFLDGVIGHYWIQNPKAWRQSQFYLDNTLVQPTTPNGYYYKAQRLKNPNAWTPVTMYSINDLIQPTEYNGYYYKAAVEGGPSTPPARSGTLEPVWVFQTNINNGIQSSWAMSTFDFSTSTPAVENTPPPTAPGATPPGGEAGGKYDNSYRGASDDNGHHRTFAQ